MPMNWPALIIGIVLAVYWTRVMVMVRQSRKKAGHGANLIPPEPLGRVLHLIWTPVTLYWIVIPFIAFFSHRHYPLPTAIAWLAALLALLCLFATFVCWRRMGTSWRMGIDPKDKTRLVFSGPYAFVRHPIYGLSSLLMIATMFVVPTVPMIVVGLVHLLLLQWEARREERHLITLHGDEYLRYSRHAGRFFPRSFRPYQQV